MTLLEFTSDNANFDDDMSIELIAISFIYKYVSDSLIRSCFMHK